MCLPAAAAALSIYSSLQQANTAAQTGAYNAALARQQGEAVQAQAEYNARLSERDATAARERADFDERRIRTQSDAVLARQRARQGVTGLALEGSPLEVLAFSAGQLELDALSARYAGLEEERALRQQATNLRYDGRIAAMGATQRAGTALLMGQTQASQYRGQAVEQGLRYAEKATDGVKFFKFGAG